MRCFAAAAAATRMFSSSSRRRHTRCLSDWSSDVCSSDLTVGSRRLRPQPPRESRPYLETALQALRTGRLTDARDALDRFLRLMEVTAPYQAALAEVEDRKSVV